MKAKQRKNLFFFDQTIRQLKVRERENENSSLRAACNYIWSFDREPRGQKREDKKDWTDRNVPDLKCRWSVVQEMIIRKLREALYLCESTLILNSIGETAKFSHTNEVDGLCTIANSI